MAYCYKCGKEIEDGSVKCDECAAKSKKVNDNSAENNKSVLNQESEKGIENGAAAKSEISRKVSLKNKLISFRNQTTKKQKALLFTSVGVLLAVILMLILFTTHVLCIHKWTSATCTQPQICIICEREQGEPLGHDWKAATCTESKTCSICGIKEGEVLGHKWADATCLTAKTCSVCKKTEGDPLGHSWEDANCKQPKTCSLCGETEGIKSGHSWEKATCRTAKTCSVCGKTSGEKLGHDWKEATCQKPKICKRCNQTTGGVGDHNWEAATFTKPKTCTVCGKTEGEKKSAYGLNALDIAAISLDEFLTLFPGAEYNDSPEGDPPGYTAVDISTTKHIDGSVSKSSGYITNSVYIGMTYNDIKNALGEPDSVELNGWSMAEYMVYYINGYKVELLTFEGSCSVTDSNWVLEYANVS